VPEASLGVVVKAPLTAVFVFPKAEVMVVPMVANCPFTPVAVLLSFDPIDSTVEVPPIFVGSSTGLVGQIEVRAPGVCTHPTVNPKKQITSASK
jgi:hypothetical protein